MRPVVSVGIFFYRFQGKTKQNWYKSHVPVFIVGFCFSDVSYFGVCVRSCRLGLGLIVQFLGSLVFADGYHFLFNPYGHDACTAMCPDGTCPVSDGLGRCIHMVVMYTPRRSISVVIMYISTKPIFYPME